MEIPNVIVMLGPPGSGKGTQGKLLADTLQFAYFSMGSYLREYSLKETELAKKIKTTIDSGHIIPDEWIKELFYEKINAIPNDAKGLILDGFPRDIDQVKLFHEFEESHHVKKTAIVYLEVPEEKLVSRINSRPEVRADDNPGIIHTRFAEYTEKTLPLRDYFQKSRILIAIDGDHPIEQVQQTILEQVKHALGI